MQTLFLIILQQIATLASGIGQNKKLFILIYHRVLDKPDFMRPDEVNQESFSWHMRILAKYFNVISLSEALEKLETGQLPSRAVCITFDDGYADNYLSALPILKKDELTATFFIANGYLNGGIMWNDKVIEAVRRLTSKTLDLERFGLENFEVSDDTQKLAAANKIIINIKHLDSIKRLEIADFIMEKVEKMPTDLMMTDEQLVNLYQAGMDIGGHTVTHPIMANLDINSLKQEINENKQKLEQLLKTSINFFAYPNGKPGIDYKSFQIEEVKFAGYQAALSTQWGVANKNSDLMQLPRFTPWDNNPIKFMLRMIWIYFRGDQ